MNVKTPLTLFTPRAFRYRSSGRIEVFLLRLHWPSCIGIWQDRARADCDVRDLEILNLHADELNTEAEDVLRYQPFEEHENQP